MWTKLKDFHWNSLTVGWAHLLGWLGVAMEALYQFPDVAQSVGLANYVPPAYLGRYTFFLAAVTLASRVRGLIAAVPRNDNDPSTDPTDGKH